MSTPTGINPVSHFSMSASDPLRTPPFILPSKLPQVGTTIFATMARLTAEHNAISLAQGAPDFACPEPLIDRIVHYLKAGMNQYAPMEGVLRLRERIAEKTERSYGYAPDPVNEVTVTTGATEGLFAAITAVVRPDDEVIVLEPCYDSYLPAIQLSGGKAIRLSLTPGTYQIPWDALANALNVRTRLLIINSPHNPTGTLLTKPDVQKIAGLLRPTETLLISDEVYEHIIFDGEPHWSILREPALRERSFVLSSFGKTYHATGWKVGYCIAPAALTKELRSVHQFLVFSTHTPTQYALADYLAAAATYETLPRFYQQRRDYFRSLMAQTRFQLLPCRGSYFQLASYAHLTDELDSNFAIRLTKEHRVSTIPVSAFYQDKTNHQLLRFCFAKQNDTLERAVERLINV